MIDDGVVTYWSSRMVGAASELTARQTTAPIKTLKQSTK